MAQKQETQKAKDTARVEVVAAKAGWVHGRRQMNAGDKAMVTERQAETLKAKGLIK